MNEPEPLLKINLSPIVFTSLRKNNLRCAKMI